MVSETNAPDPAYRPAHPFCAVDLRRNGYHVPWFRSCSVRATAKIASMTPRPRSPRRDRGAGLGQLVDDCLLGLPGST